MTVVQLRRRIHRGNPGEPPCRHAEALLIFPPFALEDRLDAVALFARLKVEALGAYLGIERGERPDLLVGRDHGDEGSSHAPRGVAAEQVAGAERVAPQQLVIARIERTAASDRDPASRHAPNDGRHALDWLAHFGGGVPFDRVAFAAEVRRQTPSGALLAAGPNQPARAQGERFAVVIDFHPALVEPVDVLPAEDPEPELVPGELHRGFGKIEAQLLKAAAPARNEDIAGGGEREDSCATAWSGRWEQGAGRKGARCAYRPHGLEEVATRKGIAHPLLERGTAAR